MNDDKFYDCIHGYFYDIPEYYVHLQKCNVQEECNCADCPNFTPKNVSANTYIQCHICQKYFNVSQMNFSKMHWYCNNCYGGKSKWLNQN